MKKVYIKLIGLAFGTLFSLFVISPAGAQQRGALQTTGGGGSSGGSNSSGSSGGSTNNSGGNTTNNNSNSNNNNATNTSRVSPPAQNFNFAPRNNVGVAPPPRTDNGNSNQSQRNNNNSGVNNYQFQHNNPNAGQYQHNNPNGGQFQRNNPNNNQVQHNNTGIAPQQGGNNNAVIQQRGSNFNIGPRQGFVQGQRGYYNNPNNRGGISPNNVGYRTYPALPYGRNHITVRPRGVYYTNRGYYRTYYAPRIGFRINILPDDYYQFDYDSYRYFYSEGLYYQFDNNEYSVVEPPVGAAITTLPPKAQSIVINGVQYYESNGVYYQPITKDDGTIVYQIAGKDGELNTAEVDQDTPPQVGDMVETLPQDCKTLKLNGKKYYVTADGYYFQDATDPNGNKVYKIVGVPNDEPDNK